MHRAFLLAVVIVLLPTVSAQSAQVHLGLATSDPSTALTVEWLASQPDNAPVVTLDTSAGPKSFAGHLVSGPSAGFAYEANLTGLAPGTNYTYHVAGSTFAFSTPPTNAGSFSFAALGDMGTDDNAAVTMRALRTLDPTFVLHSGDISYAGGDPQVWAAWFALVEPLAATRPWVTALGNHEANVEGAGAPVVGTPVLDPIELAFYQQRFGLPGNELYYSFDWQGAHFVALDTFSQVTLPPEESAWLDKDLAAHANATWTIVFLHEPPYSSNAAHGSSQRVQQAFVSIFEKNRVDLVIAAHDHAYERFGQLLGGAPQPGGPTTFTKGVAPLYVVSGGGGNGLYSTWKDPLAPGSLAHDASYHVLSVRVSPEHLDARYVATGSETTFADAFSIQSGGPDSAHADAQGRKAEAAPIAIVLVGVAVLALARRFRA